jgi:hypothetical protein
MLQRHILKFFLIVREKRLKTYGKVLLSEVTFHLDIQLHILADKNNKAISKINGNRFDFLIRFL